MAYQATVINVMIASPGDVDAERSTIQATIHKWNTVNAEDRRTVLMPVMWETHATPEMGSRPQEVINRQVLEKCDLLVAVFWTRLGSPTGSSSSGTVEEIRKHLELQKPAMVYFSQKPVALDSVDHDQYETLKAFREECKKTGLIAMYDSLEGFSEQFHRNLSQIVRDRFTNAADRRNGDGPGLTQPKRHAVSADAKFVLVSAADGDGNILQIRMLGGTSIRAGARDLETGDRRKLARWEAAIRELVNAGFVESRGFKNEIFTVTHDGYGAVELFRADAISIPED